MRTNHLNLKNSLKYFVLAVLVGTSFAIIEYFIRIDTTDPQALMPLVVRANANAVLIIFSIFLVDSYTLNGLRKKRFLTTVLYRASSYTLIITFWLVLINGIWGIFRDNQSFRISTLDYIHETTYPINLATGFLMMTLLVGIQQVNKLHRKGELFELITGKYHTPREVKRIFCFIDITASTTIAEKLGHYKYSCFLQDFYSDITDAILSTKAEVYQYVGDEVVLTWPIKVGLKNNNAITCFMNIKTDLKKLDSKYVDKYGFIPKFNAGIHGGDVTVTWVGEVKKAIVFVGDVVNTSARIQELSKKLDSDFLISEELLGQFNNLEKVKATFIDEITPRGKEQSLRIFSLETSHA